MLTDAVMVNDTVDDRDTHEEADADADVHADAQLVAVRDGLRDDVAHTDAQPDAVSVREVHALAL